MSSKDKTHRDYIDSIHRRRRILIAAMGGVCEDCGCNFGLEFHHVNPRTWTARDLSRASRQKKYEEEWERGELMLLCGWCNKYRGKPRSETTDEVPF